MKIKTRLSLPVIFGLIVASLDLILWLWFLVYALTHDWWMVLAEGVLGMVIIHFPASILLPTLGSIILRPFLSSDSLIPQTIFLFIVGIIQYFLIGYLLGCLVCFMKKFFIKHKDWFLTYKK